MKKLLAVALLFSTPLLIAAQSKVLVLKNRIPTNVTVEGHRSFAYPTACDEQGRSYVKLVEPGPGMVGSIYRLSSKGVLEAKFDTSEELMNRYAVRPNGGVAMVRLDEEGRKVIDNFGPDGARGSAVHLDRPPVPIFPDQIAVFRSGEILISGPARRGSNASTAVYDSTGHLIKQFVLDGDADIEHDAEARSVAITADDGLVYLMRATSPARVYAISPSGAVVRKILVNAPTETGLPNFGLRVSKNRMAIAFSRTCESRGGRSSCEGGTIYTVVNATTGQKLADYVPEGGLGSMIACYAPDPDRFFLFSIPPTEHRLEILEAGPN